MKHKALVEISPKLIAPIVKSLLDGPDTPKDLKEWLLKKIAEMCAIKKGDIDDR
jgi:hypothetical protein